MGRTIAVTGRVKDAYLWQVTSTPSASSPNVAGRLATAKLMTTTMLKQLVRESSLLAPDFASFKRQELTFTILNLVLLIVLMFHALFVADFANPPAILVIVLALGLLSNAAHLLWIRGRESLSADGIAVLTWAMIALNMTIAFVLASISYRQDIQYFVLLIAPLLQAAFRLSLGATLLVVAVSDALVLFWVWNYFRLHPPPEIGEYFEAGTISLIFATTGPLVWTLVNHLRAKQSDLARSLVQLEQAKERLLVEEKLSAVGRFSSAIAHEIRNPVAMISSALSTAFDRSLNSEESREMFEIAAKEASRLEKLTSDFLSYARPRSPSLNRGDVADSIAYIADICRPRAAEAAVAIRTDTRDGLWTELDGGQLQQALLNLVMNAIEASPAGSIVVLRGSRDKDNIRIDVENSAGPIPADAVACIFEPFFTTKPSGTGLGLAIARSIAIAHGGELILSRNEATVVRFSITLPVRAEAATEIPA